MSDQLLNLIRREIERALAARYSERHGLVTSYDPKNHLAKVAFQPEGTESGFMPIETSHAGSGYGILIGLTPGGGKTDGDQVIVRYQEGDYESGKIVKVVHSDQDKPPEVQAGEMLFQHKSGAKMFLDKDGKATFTDKTGNSSMVMDGSGTVTMSSKGGSIKMDSSGNCTVTAAKFDLNGSGDCTITAGNIILNGNVALGGTGGKPLAIQGTTDTAGNADIGNLATKVTAV